MTKAAPAHPREKPHHPHWPLAVVVFALAFGAGLSGANKTIIQQQFIPGLANNSINLLQGPIVLQDGITYVPAGQTIADKQLWYMPQLLQGMTGSSATTK